MKSENLDSLKSVIEDMSEKYKQLEAYAMFSEQARQASSELFTWINKLIVINNSEQDGGY